MGLVIWICGCAIAPGPSASPAPSTFTALEQALRAEPLDARVAELLGATYLFEGRAGEARLTLSAAREQHAEDSGLVFLLALTEEGLGNRSRALDLYQSYLASSGYEPFAEEAQGRLDRLVLEDAFDVAERAAVSVPGAIADAVDPQLVVVVPFVDELQDPYTSAVAAAMGELLTADIAASAELNPVDPVRVRALLQRLAPEPATWTDPRVGAEVAAVLGAGLVVQARLLFLEDNSIRVVATVRSVSPGAGGSLQFDDSEPPARVSGLKDRLLALLLEYAAIEPLADDRVVRSEGSSERLPAWLEFGAGLMALEEGGYEAAAEHFMEAYGLDPLFTLAEARADRALWLAASTEAPGELGWRAAQISLQRSLVLAQRQQPGSTHRQALHTVGARGRAVLAELLGQDRLAGGSILELIAVPGGGGPR